MAYRSIEELLLLLDEPYSSACTKILFEHRARFDEVQGSTHNHQNWPGGYLDHVREVMNIAIELYATLDTLRPLRFTRSDVLLILFLHDIEKPWKYEPAPEGGIREIEAMRGNKPAQHDFRSAKLVEYGIALNDEQQNALRYVEGEIADYRNDKRIMSPLAGFCHLCDVVSARIWFDHPADNSLPDPWSPPRSGTS